MKFPKFRLPKLTKFHFEKPSVDTILKWAQYGTYAFIVIRILVFGVQKLLGLKKKLGTR